MGILAGAHKKTIEGVWHEVATRIPDRAIRRLARLLFSRSWRSFQNACANPRATQRERLLAILKRNRESEIGHQFGFSRISSIAEFQRQVPVQAHADLAARLARMAEGESGVLTTERVVYFARTSGTTGPAKLIPVTRSFIQEYQSGARVFARQVALAFPGLVRGALLSIQSLDQGQTTPGGIPSGSITQIMGASDGGATGRLGLVDALQAVPRSVFSIEDATSRYYMILRFALNRRISLMSAINPSTLLLLAQKLTEHAEALARDCERGGISDSLNLPAELRRSLSSCLQRDRVAAARIRRSLDRHGRVLAPEVWPDLCGLLCWKAGPAPFYLNQFPAWFGRLPVMGMGYAATEGRFSIVLDPEGDAGVTALTGHFLEFVPEDGPRHGDRALTAEQLEVGQRYFVLVTGSNGLYRYDMNDLVEVTGYHHNAALIRFCHKGDNILSITGEKMSDEHVVSALTAAQASSGVSLTGFCATVDRDPPVPRYLLAIESSQIPDAIALQNLLRAAEGNLTRANMEYEAKRRSLRLGRPGLLLLSAGAFERWRLRRLQEGGFDSHLKLPHLVRDRAIMDWMGVERFIDWEVPD